MSAVNKNFVIKNGLEVDTNLILADAYTNKVGIGTTVPQYTLHVNGGIGATDLYVSGIGTIVTFQSTTGIITNLTATNLFAGVGTITRIQSTNINNIGVTTSINLNITGIATIAVGVVTFLSGTNLNYSGIGTIVSLNSTNANVSGISTLGVTSTTNLTSQTLVVSGISTLGVTSATNLTLQQLNVSGISTLGVTSTTNLTSQQLNVSGISTLGVTSSTNLTSQQLNVTGVSTLGVTSSTNLTSQTLVVSGISTLGVTSTTNLTSQQLNVSGISTLGVTSTTNLTSQQLNVSGISTLGVTSTTNLTSQQLNVSGISTVGVLTATRIGIGTTNPTSELFVVGNIFSTGITTLGTIKISSGIVSSTNPGVSTVTYYGDGNFLNLTSNPSRGVGIGTIGGVVGYAVTFIDFKGAGVSTTQYNSSTGIATIFFEGGSGISSSSSGIGIETTGGVVGYGITFLSLKGAGVSTTFYNSSTGIATIFFEGGGSSGIITSINNLEFSIGSAVSPSLFFNSDIQTGFFSPSTGQFTVVSSGSSILNINSSGINVSGIITSNGANFNSNEINKVVLKNYTEKVQALGNTGISTTIDLKDANVFTATLTDNCTFTFVTGVTSGAASFTLILANDATASRTITWPVSVKWSNNVVPTRTTTASKTDIWSFFTPNNGTTWYGGISLLNFT